YKTFGTLEINTGVAPVPVSNTRKVHLSFVVDVSGSMGGTGIRRGKLSYVKSTLKHMINYMKQFVVENPQSEVKITIITFSHGANLVSDTVFNVDTPRSVYDVTLSLINSLKASGATNLCQAICLNNTCLDSSSEYDSYSIIMTDGYTNRGEFTAKERLLSLLNTNSPYIFIGYGTEHDSHMLRHLSTGKYNEYHIIENDQNAGMVYGEIVSNTMFEAYKNIVLTGENVEYYDALHDTWSSQLAIDSLSYDSEKTYHMRTVSDDLG
ncbi:MAG: VWA domain-containing protein, partial [Anaerolineales bacterium]|nr:VWA domain-containing protein [Anaerolineales bacterium]